jgi:hypothetical protein
MHTFAEGGFGDNVPNGVAGPLGLFITILLVIATVLLVRNMNSRLRRLPESFPAPGSDAAKPEATKPEAVKSEQADVEEPAP